MLISFIFSYSEKFFVVFYSSFYFVLGQGPSARDEFHLLRQSKLGEHTGPAGSMREGHVATDPRSLTVQMSHAAQDLPITTTAHAVYAEEEIQSQTMQG